MIQSLAVKSIKIVLRRSLPVEWTVLRERMMDCILSMPSMVSRNTIHAFLLGLQTKRSWGNTIIGPREIGLWYHSLEKENPFGGAAKKIREVVGDVRGRFDKEAPISPQQKYRLLSVLSHSPSCLVPLFYQMFP